MSARKTIFVTGATGFIGRYVVENLLRRDHRVIALVQTSTQATKAQKISTLEDIAKTTGELAWVVGDITQPELALQSKDRIKVLQADHVFHLAALYDLEATRESLTRLNTDGTRHLCSWLAESSFQGVLHHVSSIAVAGNYQGVFTEEMFDEGQDFPHAYHQTKYDSERLVRESGLKFNIYRPGSVVGHSMTGAIDRIDGIYHAFPLLHKVSKSLPSWVKIPVTPIKGGLNIVPVDFVSDALTHIALSKPKPQACFHLTDPRGPSILKLVNTLLREAKGPQLSKLPTSMGTPGPVKAFTMLPIFQEIKENLFSELGLPPGTTMSAINLKVRFDSTETQATLAGTGIDCPPFKAYAKYIQRYYEDHFHPDNHRLDAYRDRFSQKNILITGASRGIGKSAALEAAKAGAHVILVARNADDLKVVQDEIETSGGRATAIATDLSSQDEIDRLITTVETEFGGLDALIHNAARSIRRPIAESRDRHHDYERTMRLNYFAPVRLTLGLLPGLVEREGSVVMVLTLGVLMPGPFFGAYLPSKAALDIFGDVLAAEYAHTNLHVGSVYLPLVKTAMMAPTKEYQNRVDLMTPEKAAHMILDSVAFRKRRVMLPVGRVFSFANRLAPGPTTRVLNLLRRTFPAKGETTEFPMEQAIITQAIGGSPI